MIVVHIGLRKAGSTSIQAFLRDNEAPLRAIGVDYPLIGRSKLTNHNTLARGIRDLANSDPAESTLPELAAYWRASDARVMILSAEAFEEAETEEALKLAALKRDPDEEVRIVVVIRDLVSLMPSSYAQVVKLGAKVPDFDEFFERRINLRRSDYFGTASRWADAFGWANLRVRPLDSRQLLKGDLIDDFMSHADLDLSVESAGALRRPDPANVSPGWRVVEALRGLSNGRHGLPPDHALTKAKNLAGGRRAKRRLSLGGKATKLGERLGWNDDRGRYMTRDQAQQCLDVYASSISKLNEKLPHPLPMPDDLDRRGFQERESLPDIEQIPPQELRAFYDDLAEIKGLD